MPKKEPKKNDLAAWADIIMSSRAKTVTHERITFRYLVMECCSIQLCWVNPRLPNYCPECGKHCFPQVKSMITLTDTDAQLTYHQDN